MTQFVALVCRISKDRSGKVEGVAAQQRWGRKYAGGRWPGVPIKVYADNNLSAADDTVRPAFEEFRRDLADGLIAHVWAVEQSRLERREVEWFQVAAEMDEAGIAELHTDRDGIIGVRDEVAGIKAVLNAAEVRKLKRRIRDKHADLAAAGRPGGGVAYGYRSALDDSGAKTLAIVPEQAAVIRECADWILDGWSLGRVADTLHERGLVGALRRRIRDDADPSGWKMENGKPVTRSSRITPTAVKGWLTKATVAGLRIHRGQTLPAVWEPILDIDTWNVVRDRLAQGRLVKGKDDKVFVANPSSRNSGRRYLLTGGTARCGVCDAALVCSDRMIGKTCKPYYYCHMSTGGKNCVGVVGGSFEALVVAELLDALDKPDFLAAIGVDDHAAQRDSASKALRGLEARRSALARMWAAGERDATEWAAARTELAEQERKLRDELRSIPAPVGRVDPALIRDAWEDMNLDERREQISTYIERVTVIRALPGAARRFDPDRIKITWRTR